MVSEEWLGLVRRSPLFNRLETEIQSSIDNIFKLKAQREANSNPVKLLVEYLKAMGHSNVQIQPAEVVCDLLLPDSKIAIIIQKKHLTSIENKEGSVSLHFMLSVLKNAGYSPVVISPSSIMEHSLVEPNDEKAVAYLGSMSKKKT